MTPFAWLLGLLIVGTAHAAPPPDSLFAVDKNRAEIIDDIVAAFEPQLRHSEPAGTEAAKLRSRLAKLRADYLLAAAMMSDYASLERILRHSDTASTPKALGDSGRDLVYTPITPCRLIDTRGFGAPIQGGAFSPGSRRSYAPNGLCSLPTANIASIVVAFTTQNLTPNSGGYITLLPPAAQVATSTDIFNLGTEWSQGSTLVATGGGGQFDVFVAQANAQVVVDVLGYFSRAVVNQTLATRIVKVTNFSGVGSASCVAGELAVGGGCYCSGSRSQGTNFGVLFGCTPVGISYVGGCANDSYLYSSAYGHSPVEVYVTCMGTAATGGATEQRTAGEQVLEVQQKLDEFAEQQRARSGGL